MHNDGKGIPSRLPRTNDIVTLEGLTQLAIMSFTDPPLVPFRNIDELPIIVNYQFSNKSLQIFQLKACAPNVTDMNGARRACMCII